MILWCLSRPWIVVPLCLAGILSALLYPQYALAGAIVGFFLILRVGVLRPFRPEPYPWPHWVQRLIDRK